MRLLFSNFAAVHFHTKFRSSTLNVAFFYLLIFLRLLVLRTDSDCLFDQQINSKKERTDRNEEKEDNSNVLTLCGEKHNIHIRSILHRIIHSFGWNKFPSVVFYIQSWWIKYSVQPSHIIQNSPSILFALFSLLLSFLHYYWFYVYENCSSLNQVRMDDKRAWCVRLYMSYTVFGAVY